MNEVEGRRKGESCALGRAAQASSHSHLLTRSFRRRAGRRDDGRPRDGRRGASARAIRDKLATQGVDAESATSALARLDEDGRRLTEAKQVVGALIDGNRADSAALRDYFARTDQGAGNSPFVRGPRYGTRCTTILRGGPAGLVLEETRYDADCTTTGSVSLAWSAAG